MLTITFLSLLGLVLLFLGFAGKVGLVKNLAALGVLASLGILMFANHHGIMALPQHKNIVGIVLQQKFLSSQAKIGIVVLQMNTKHKGTDLTVPKIVFFS